MEPILDYLGRFDDRLPTWMIGYKRWIGVLALGAVLGLSAGIIVVLLGYVL